MDIELLSRIESASGRLVKESLLSKADVATQSILARVCDPMITFGITVDPESAETMWSGRNSTQIEMGIRSSAIENWWDKFEAICELLQTRQLTGNAATQNVYTHLCR